MSDSDATKRRFSDAYTGVNSLWTGARRIGGVPIRVGPWYIPLWVGLLVAVEMLLLLDVGYAALMTHSEPYVSLRVHAILILVVLFGAMRKERLARFRARIGLDPVELRSAAISQSATPTNRRLPRAMAILVLSGGMATLNLWTFYLARLTAEELGVDLTLTPWASFFDLWGRVMATNGLRATWLEWFVLTAVILTLLQFTPISQWLVKKTALVHLAALVLWSILAISWAFWWDKLYGLGLV